MSRQTKTLKKQARKMVYDVYCFMVNEAKEEEEEDLINLPILRTSAATNISLSTVRRIKAEASKIPIVGNFPTPGKGKKRPRSKLITRINDFDKGIVRRCIHDYYVTNKELPTINELHQKLQKDISFYGGEKRLRLVMKDLGFLLKKTDNNRHVAVEKSNIRLKRIDYLQKLKKFRDEGRPIIYIGELWSDACVSSTTSHSSNSIDVSDQRLKNTSKSQCDVIIYAGSDSELLLNSIHIFKLMLKAGDHDNIALEDYVWWVQTKLVPNIPPNSVVVVDSKSSFHNKEYEPAPTAYSQKNYMQLWLSDKKIPYTPTMLKPELYKLIKANKDKTFYIDNILSQIHHDVLRLPPEHPDLKPIEMAWASIENHLFSNNVEWNLKSVMTLIQEKANDMGVIEWRQLCDKTKQIEDLYNRK